MGKPYQINVGCSLEQELGAILSGSANEVQVGGDHYRKYGDFQPWDTFMRWNLNPFAAHIIPYLVRYRDKATANYPAGSAGAKIEHLEKARHFLDKWIEEEKREAGWESAGT